MFGGASPFMHGLAHTLGFLIATFLVIVSSELLPGIDWVGFDVKAPFADYVETTGVRASGGPAQESLRQLIASGVAYEVRTTRHADLLPSGKLRSMAAALRQQGVQTFALQEFRADGCADASLDPRPQPMEDHDLNYLQQLFPTFILRRAS